MFALFGKDKELIIENREAILADFKMLFTQDKTFIESIESSTASPARFQYRVNKLKEILNNYL